MPRTLTLTIPGQPDQVQGRVQRSQNHCRRRGRQRPLERCRADVRWLHAPGHVQVRPLRDLQRRIHEPRWRGSLRKVQGRHLARRLCYRRGLRRHRAMSARDDQSQDPDEPAGDIPGPHARRDARDAQAQGRDAVSVWLPRPALVASGSSRSHR